MSNRIKTALPYVLIFIGILSLLVGCEVNKNPDVSNIEVNLNIIRYDQLLFGIDTLSVPESFDKIEKAHPEFTELFFTHVLPIKDKTNPKDKLELSNNIKTFIVDDFARSLYDTTQIVYPNLEASKKDLEQTFKYIKYYFPEVDVENIYAFVSEFGYQTFLFTDQNGRDAIGLGLDMFLNDFPYKKFAPSNPAFSHYITRAFNEAHISKKVSEAILDDVMTPVVGERLIDQMIFNGKKLFMLEKFLPFKQDSIIFEYTAAQMQWVKENELNIWVHLLGEDLIYETNRKKTRSLIERSPTSNGMPAESPGQTANYIGYRIIGKYMERNPQVSIDSLLKMEDAQKILDDARYKPTAQ